MSIKITSTDNFYELGKFLKQASKKYNFKDSFKKVSKLIEDKNKDNFRARGRINIWDKAKSGQSVSMVKTGNLEKSLTTSGGDSIREITSQSLVFGSRLSYGLYHQKGIKKTGLKRETLQVGGKDIKEISKILINDFFDDLIK